MKKLIIGLAVASTLFLSSCANPVIITPVAATSNAVGAKVGEAKGFLLFDAIAFDVDVSIKTAAANGGITAVSTVDIKREKVMFGTEITCIVTGE